jgi:isoquinoline 1-oxidoreductase subunit alpha
MDCQPSEQEKEFTVASTLNVNGERREVTAAPEMPLLWALREQLALTGTKYGCGIAQCGACTVHVDGKPVRACVTPVSAAVGKRITTIEGLGSKEAPHPVQRAWTEVGVPQCGYCQSGQIMSAVALLAEKPEPTDTDIDAAMAGNLCRCGTYNRIRAAIHKATALMRVKAPA